MKIYNNNLEKIENNELETYFDELVNNQIEFAGQYANIDTSNLHANKEKIRIVKTTDTYKFIADGNIIERKFPQMARAFATKMTIEHNEKHLDINYGVYVKDFNDLINLVHELYHSLSGRNQLVKDDKNNFYDKIGLLVTEYDKDENPIDRSLYAQGLNEGITELLSTKFLNRNSPSAYDFQVYISDILIGMDKTLLSAYFSNDRKEFITFLDNFSKRQNTISKDILVSMPSAQNLPFDKMLLVLKGSIEYATSFTKTKEELQIEYQRLNQIVTSMKNNLNVCETEEEYLNIKQILDDIIFNKQLELESNEVSTELSNKSLGYSKISLLIIINILIITCIIFLGIIITR